MPSEPKLHPSTDPYDHASCSLTRENLDEYLAQSGYGANVAMFSCYFVRHVFTGAPLCITCGRPIGEHCSARLAVVPATVVRDVTAASADGRRPPPPTSAAFDSRWPAPETAGASYSRSLPPLTAPRSHQPPPSTAAATRPPPATTDSRPPPPPTAPRSHQPPPSTATTRPPPATFYSRPPAPPTAVTATASISGATVEPEAIAVVPPEGLKIGDTQDVFEVKRSWGPLVAVVVLSIFLAVELGIFFGLGLQRTVPFAFIVPAIVFLAILVVMGMPTVSRIVFTKGNGPQSAVVVTRRRLFGCETGAQTTVEGLGQVGFRETQYRRGIDFTVMAVSASGEETALHTSMSYTAAIAQYSAWRAYFAQYGIAAHPTLMPTVTSFA